MLLAISGSLETCVLHKSFSFCLAMLTDNPSHCFLHRTKNVIFFKIILVLTKA